MLRHAISNDALHDCERGYEHLPEVMDAEIKQVQSKYEEMEDYEFENEDAFDVSFELIKIIEQKQREQFNNVFIQRSQTKLSKKEKP